MGEEELPFIPEPPDGEPEPCRELGPVGDDGAEPGPVESEGPGPGPEGLGLEGLGLGLDGPEGPDGPEPGLVLASGNSDGTTDGRNRLW